MTQEEFAERFGPSLRRAMIADRHIADKKRWPWYGRLFHRLFVSWRCESCAIQRSFENPRFERRREQG